MRRCVGIGTLALGLALIPVTASAQSGPEKEARAFFELANQAFDQGRFGEAVAALRAAVALTPRPNLVYSLGLAQEKQFYVDGKRESLVAAIGSFRRYLALSPEGDRRDRAVAGIQRLTALLPGLPAPSAKEKPRVEKAKTGHLMVYSDAKGARVSVDGAPSRRSPSSLELSPGGHRVRVTAPGHLSRERSVQIPVGATVPLQVLLEPRPAALHVLAPAGATIWVNGRVAGEGNSTLKLPPGIHDVAVTQSGHRSARRRVELAAGAADVARFSTETTAQRSAAWVTLGGAGLTALSGVVFTLLTLQRQNDALPLSRQLDDPGQSLTVEENERLDDLHSERDTFRLAAGVSFGVSAAAALTAVGLFVFDRPGPPQAERTPGVPEKPKGPGLEFGALTMPGGGSVTLGGHF